MFGFGSNHTETFTQTPTDGNDVDDGFVLSFEPYPEMSPPQPAVGWRPGEPALTGDIWPDEIDDSDPQPGYDDHDFDD